MDLVLSGGLLIDGTGAPGREADVGVAAGRVAAIERAGTLRAAQAIDCRGLCVAPGFIDTHSHSDLRVLVDPALPPKSRQGITFEVLGQDGISVAPVAPDAVGPRRHRLAGLLTDPAVGWGWRSVADYLREVARARPRTNHAYLVPHGAIRESVVGMEDRPATAAEIEAMRRAVAEALDQGAAGMSTGLIYPPCCYATTGELAEICRPLGERGLAIVVHVRSESDAILDAIDEMVEVARQSRARLHVSHLKIAGRRNWPLADELEARLRGAIASGVKVTADQYPYTAGSTMLGAVLPPWAHTGSLSDTVGRLTAADTRARMRAEIADPSPARWDNFWQWSGPEGIVIADIPSGRDPDLVGLSLAEAARRRGADPFDFTFDLLARERMGVAMVSHSQSEDVVRRFLRLPFVNVCTDALLGGRPHPRAFGSYPRVLGRYVRDLGVVSLEEAVRKMTSQAADAIGLAGFGRAAAGARADLVVFDPATVADRATFEDPTRFPVGIRHVIVGGRPILRDEELLPGGGEGVVVGAAQ